MKQMKIEKTLHKKKLNDRQINNLHGEKESSRHTRERVTEGMKKLGNVKRVKY